MPQFMCLIYVDEAALNARPRAEHLAGDEEDRAFNRSLQASGHLIASSALASLRDAVTIRRRDGKLSATDGPFAETKEYLGGYFLIEARDRDEAVSVMSRDPHTLHATIEIREAKSIMDEDWRAWADRTFRLS